MDKVTFDEYKKDLNVEICTHKETLEKILLSIGWEPNKTTSVEMGWCPIISHHHVPLSSLKRHTVSCSARNSPIMTTHEKLGAYEKALESCASLKTQDDQHLVVDTSQSSQKKETVSFLEELQKERDSKRRRVAYRKRGTHTGRKSRTEKMRDLIGSIMDSLNEERQIEKS